jgi:integrase
MRIGFTGAMRRSELVAFDIEDVRFVEVGATIEIRRSKADQTGEGVLIPLPFGSRETTCPVRALKAWLDAAGIESGAIFRSMNRHGQFGEAECTLGKYTSLRIA